MFHRGRSQLKSCGLVCALAFVLAGPIAAAWADDPPPDFKMLQRDFYKAYKTLDYQKALGLLEKMHEARPADVDTIYNLACVNCLLGNKEKAYSWIDEALKAGYRDAEQLALDDDFKTIRAEDRFRAIVKRLRGQRLPASQPPGKPEPPKTTQPAKAEAGEKPAKSETPKKPEAPKKSEPPAKPEKPVKSEKPAKPEKSEAPAKPEKPVKPEKPAKPEKPEKPAKKEMSPEKLQARVMELTQKLIAASEEGKDKEALELALEAHKLADSGLTNYNVACMYSRLGQKDEAFKYLGRAIELGGLDTDMAAQIENDRDFDKIRKDPRYAQALEKAGGRKAEPAPKGEAEEAKTVAFEWKVTLPKKYDASKKVALIVALHGQDGNMEKAAKQWAEAANEVGAILLTPQGTYSPQDGRFRWGRDLDAIEENVLDAIDQVMDKYQIDGNKVVLAGFSEGGWAAWQILLRNPDAFRGIIPVAGRFEARSDAAFEDPDLAKTRVYIMVGAEDNEPLVESNRQAAERFAEIGAKVKLKVYDGVGHAFPKKAGEEQVKALRFVLGK